MIYAEYIMRNAGLDEAQAGIKTAKRNEIHIDLPMYVHSNFIHIGQRMKIIQMSIQK